MNIQEFVTDLRKLEAEHGPHDMLMIPMWQVTELLDFCDDVFQLAAMLDRTVLEPPAGRVIASQR